jgi:hypothetical protein
MDLMSYLRRLFKTGLFTIGNRVYAFAYVFAFRCPIVNAVKFVKQGGWAIMETPKEAYDYVLANTTYQTDRQSHNMFECWQTPDATALLGTGDCFDMALRAYSRIPNAEMWCVHLKDGTDHFFCVARPIIDAAIGLIRVDPAKKIYGSQFDDIDFVWLKWNENGVIK